MIAYTKELGNAIRDFDLTKFKQFMLRHATCEQIAGGFFGHTDKWYEGLMAKMVLVRTDMPVETICKAKKVLDELNWRYGIEEETHKDTGKDPGQDRISETDDPSAGF